MERRKNEFPSARWLANGTGTSLNKSFIHVIPLELLRTLTFTAPDFKKKYFLDRFNSTRSRSLLWWFLCCSSCPHVHEGFMHINGSNILGSNNLTYNWLLFWICCDVKPSDKLANISKQPFGYMDYPDRFINKILGFLGNVCNCLWKSFNKH